MIRNCHRPAEHHFGLVKHSALWDTYHLKHVYNETSKCVKEMGSNKYSKVDCSRTRYREHLKAIHEETRQELQSPQDQPQEAAAPGTG